MSDRYRPMRPNVVGIQGHEPTGMWFDEADFLPTHGWTKAMIQASIPKRQESRRAYLLRGVQPLALIFSYLPTIPCEVIDRVGLFQPLSFDRITKEAVPARGIMHIENWHALQKRGERVAAILAGALERATPAEEVEPAGEDL